MQKIH